MDSESLSREHNRYSLSICLPITLCRVTKKKYSWFHIRKHNMTAHTKDRGSFFRRIYARVLGLCGPEMPGRRFFKTRQRVFLPK
jgi:hypothetical protein